MHAVTGFARDMAAEWKSEKKIEFSREHVRFVNEKCKKQETFYLYNRAGISKKLRVAVTNHSDKVRGCVRRSISNYYRYITCFTLGVSCALWYW